MREKRPFNDVGLQQKMSFSPTHFLLFLLLFFSLVEIEYFARSSRSFCAWKVGNGASMKMKCHSEKILEKRGDDDDTE